MITIFRVSYETYKNANYKFEKQYLTEILHCKIFFTIVPIQGKRANQGRRLLYKVYDMNMR